MVCSISVGYILCCSVILTVERADPSTTSLNYFVLSLSNFKVDSTVLLAVITVLCIRSPELVFGAAESESWGVELKPDWDCGRLQPAESPVVTEDEDECTGYRSPVETKGTARTATLSGGQCTDPCLGRLLLFSSGFTSERVLLSIT